MRRVLFDTNIYGKIVENEDILFVTEVSENLLRVYGSVVINRELREYKGKTVLKFNGKVRKFRALLFEVYDLLVKNKIYPIDDNVKRLAEGYFIAYTKFGGKKTREQIINDFLIVATASIHRLEIIYSDDSKTMISKEAIKAYELVNGLNDLAMPQLKNYQELKNELKEQSKRWSA